MTDDPPQIFLFGSGKMRIEEKKPTKSLKMFVRIVKMSFEPSKIDAFLAFFEIKKELIRGFEGCEFLELYRDKTHPNILFTYSYWNAESDLENYRNSDLFKSVWATTKQFFNDKPQAWSLDKLVSIR